MATGTQITRAEDVKIIGFDECKGLGCFKSGSLVTYDAWMWIFNPEDSEIQASMQLPIQIVALINEVGWKCYYGTIRESIERIAAHGVKIDDEDLARSYFPFLDYLEFKV